MEIKAESLSKNFGGNLALDQVSFRLDGIGAHGYLGPNGAGKTTTMKIMTSLLRPDKGTAYINGINVSKEPVATLRLVRSLKTLSPILS